MRLSISLFTVAALLFVVAPGARADSIQLSINSSVTTSLQTPGDNYWGFYYSWAPQSIVYPTVRNQRVDANFSNVSLFLPAGSIVTSATMDVLLPISDIGGTGFITLERTLPRQYYDQPSTAPTPSSIGSSDVMAEYLGSHLIPAIINGNEISTGDLNVQFDLNGRIRGGMLTPGSNWAGYIGGSGQVTIPYTVQLMVAYSVVPEPSSIALFSTGILGFAGFLRRRFLSQS